jgi:hypothetical protein
VEHTEFTEINLGVVPSTVDIGVLDQRIQEVSEAVALSEVNRDKDLIYLMPESGITLSGETRNIKGGFMLKNGSVYINGTVEALIDEARDELVTEVAQVLFQ